MRAGGIVLAAAAQRRVELRDVSLISSSTRMVAMIEKMLPVSIHPVKLSPGNTGRHSLREVISFCERAGFTQHQLRDPYKIDPMSILGADRLEQCGEAFVAES